MGTSWGTSWCGVQPGFPLPFLDPLGAGHMVPLPSEHRRAWLWRTLVLAMEGPGRALPLYEDTSCRPGEHSVSVAPFPVFGDFNKFPSVCYSVCSGAWRSGPEAPPLESSRQTGWWRLLRAALAPSSVWQQALQEASQSHVHQDTPACGKTRKSPCLAEVGTRAGQGSG